jgi:hypothetical protein
MKNPAVVSGGLPGASDLADETQTWGNVIRALNIKAD